MTHGLFQMLTGARTKRFVEIGQATHMLLMERTRQQAFDAIGKFLEEHAGIGSSDGRAKSKTTTTAN